MYEARIHGWHISIGLYASLEIWSPERELRWEGAK